MKRLRKIIFMTCMLIFTTLFTACGEVSQKNEEKIHIVCTLFPQYDWVREIVGESENVEISLLTEKGGDIHNYQPSADDIITISTCDMFIYCGGTSDKWVEDALKQARNKDMVVINMLDAIGDKAILEENVEGMEDDSHDACEEEGHHHGAEEYDEHIWLSISNSKIICDKIYEGLCIVDSENKNVYEKKHDLYDKKLDELDGKYKTMVENSAINTILVADRFPFRYLTDEYGINYFAAFVGCSSDTEASFETVTFLAKKLDELKLDFVIVVDGSTQDVAKTVIESSHDKNQSIIILDSLQGVSMDRIKKGDTYLSIMENNYNVLNQVLN